jgi:citrate lyase subunit beta / citryl-CoA lyase
MSNLRRSALYVPGDSEKMIRRSASSISDMLLLNLEDGVALSKKDLARDLVRGALRGVDFGAREKVVRVNSLNTGDGRRDLAAVIPARPDGICLPKVEKAGDIQAADDTVRELENSHGISPGTIQLHAMIESAAGVLHSQDIAAASPRMASLIFGSADYADDVRCQPGDDRIELLFALQMIVNSARSAGIDGIDAPCFDLRNQALLVKESTQARHLGFSGKSALHPDQLAAINRAFDITDEEVAWAERVLTELDEAENSGKALSTMDGRLIDNPHRRIAERILSQKTLRIARIQKD